MSTTTTPRHRRGALGTTALVLAVAGLVASAYLTYEHATASTTLACPETSTINCAKVTSSQYSTFAGIPVAILGLVFYVVLVALLLLRPRLGARRTDQVSLLLTTGGLAFALYLVWAELFRINAICLWCTGVHLVTLVLFGVLAFAVAAGESD